MFIQFEFEDMEDAIKFYDCIRVSNNAANMNCEPIFDETFKTWLVDVEVVKSE